MKTCLTLGFLIASIALITGAAAGLEIRAAADSVRDERRDAPGNVIDGSVANSSRWVSVGKRGVTDGSDPHWLSLEFDRPVEFDQVRLLSGYGNEVSSALRDYTIEIDRDDRWVEVVRASGNGLLDVTHEVPVVETRKVRINIQQGAVADSFARIKEIRLYCHGVQVVPEAVDRQHRYFAAQPIVGQEDEFCRRA